MEIRRYKKEDEPFLLRLLESEGSEWECYSAPDAVEKFKSALADSITYVAFEDGTLCGYSRSVEDNGFYIYISDLLVAKPFRCRKIGQMLMECVCRDYSDHTVYVLSDVDGYYQKKGFSREGSVFEVSCPDLLSTQGSL